MQINVTQKHIEQGNRRCPHCCPITLSLKEMGYEIVAVRERVVVFDHAAFYLLPKAARIFVEKFDRRQPVKPFTFELEHEAQDDGKEPCECMCPYPLPEAAMITRY